MSEYRVRINNATSTGWHSGLTLVGMKRPLLVDRMGAKLFSLDDARRAAQQVDGCTVVHESCSCPAP